MNSIRLPRAALFSCLLSILAIACGGDRATPTGCCRDAPSEELEILADRYTLFPGDSETFFANFRNAYGITVSAPAPVTFTSTDSTKVRIDRLTGQAFALDTGNVSIQASMSLGTTGYGVATSVLVTTR